ncbi:MAG: lysine--tRNA ligase, partial [Clostridiales Family XIII bacterium]|nr:lysine--tRNA ligase [Clostridiales Family XIII bacterium]
MSEDKTRNEQAQPSEQDEELSSERINELRKIRRDKLQKLRDAGRDPFKNEKWNADAFSLDIKADYEEREKQVPEGEAPAERAVSICGRVMAFRDMGKASFIDIQDKQGRIQAYVRKDAIGDEEYSWFKTYDIGDIIGLEGTVFKTRHGEISVKASKVVLLSKSIQILPNKRQGLKDTELRYRQRYVDLIMNPEVKDDFVKRAAVVREIKRYLEDEEGFLEVDTPVLTTIAGGANARPFGTHHNTLDLDVKLRISNELYLKRLTVGGLDRVYEMGKMFRNEGMDKNHNPEYTAMELYQAYGNAETVMRLTENIASKAALAATGSMVITYQGKTFDLTPPWERLSMQDAV